MSSLSLRDLRVLVTRASHQQSSFVRALRTAQAIPISLPLSEICIVDDPTIAQEKFLNLNHYDFVIFVSTNAVDCSHKILKFPWESFYTQFTSIGNATREKLLHYGQSVNITPIANPSTEGLLDLAVFHSVIGKRIAIIGGSISRELLEQTLVQRGAYVDFIMVYENRLPTYLSSHIGNVFFKKKPQIICITSNQGILNLLDIVGPGHLQGVLELPLVVNSFRCSKLAKKLGFKSDIVIAEKPGDFGQLKALEQWYLNQPMDKSDNNYAE